MGEEKRKRKLKEKLLSDFPYCIYCGGKTVADTVEHLPPISVFDQRYRPSGLEFPACRTCNSGSRLDDQAIALFSRMHPDPHTEEGKSEVKKLMKEVNNNHPGLLLEMRPSFRQKKIARRTRIQAEDQLGAINCTGPLLNGIIHRFGAKVGFALHYELTKSPVPIGGGTSVWWATNGQRLEGDFPDELLDMLGRPKTLQQGKKSVADQFQYSSIGTPDGTMSVHFAAFRFSFAIFAFTSVDAEKITPPDNINHVTLHKPGWLKT